MIKRILIFTSDDHGFPYWGFQDHPIVKTPRIDALAKRSLLFPHGVSSAPKCEHAFQGLLTGLEAKDQIKGGTNNLDLSASFLLTRALRDAEFRVMWAGKYWEGDILSHCTDAFDAGATATKFGRQTIQPVLDFIANAESAQQSWMVVANPRIPHLPFPHPEYLPFRQHLSLYDDVDMSGDWLAWWKGVRWAKKYYAMISWMDSIYGALEDHLSSVLDDTLIIVWSDNGFALRRSKDAFTHNGMATPIIVSLPGVAPDRLNHIVSCIDFLPTILDYVEVDVPPLPDARSLWDLSSWRTWKPQQWRKGNARSAYTGTHRIVANNHGRVTAVYNVVTDPDETLNLLRTPEGLALAEDYGARLEVWHDA